MTLNGHYARDLFLEKEMWEPNSGGSRFSKWGDETPSSSAVDARIEAPKACTSPEKKIRFWISNSRFWCKLGAFLYSSPKAGLNAVPIVKITSGNAVPRRSRWKRSIRIVFQNTCVLEPTTKISIKKNPHRQRPRCSAMVYSF